MSNSEIHNVALMCQNMCFTIIPKTQVQMLWHLCQAIYICFIGCDIHEITCFHIIAYGEKILVPMKKILWSKSHMKINGEEVQLEDRLTCWLAAKLATCQVLESWSLLFVAGVGVVDHSMQYKTGCIFKHYGNQFNAKYHLWIFNINNHL